MHDELDDSLGFALKRLQQTLRARMDAALARFGLTTPQYLALSLLAEHPGIANAELARRAAVAAPTMLRLLTALEAAGHVTRADRTPELRARGTELTERGAGRLAAARDVVRGFEQRLAAGAGADRDVVLSWLRRCADDLAER